FPRLPSPATNADPPFRCARYLNASSSQSQGKPPFSPGRVSVTRAGDGQKDSGTSTARPLGHSPRFPTPAHQLVQKTRPRPPLAAHARPLCHFGFRGDAAADARTTGDAVL